MPSRIRWNPSKRRSAAQKAHAAQLYHSTLAAKENLPPQSLKQSSGSSNPDATSSEKVKMLTSQLKNAIRREKRAKITAATSRKRAREAEAESKHLAARAEASRQRIERLEEKTYELKSRADAMTKRLQRIPAQTERAVKKAVSRASSSPHTLSLKEKGVITNPSRDMVRDLVGIWNVPVASINGVINAVSAAAGLEVEGMISTRSVGRVMREADIASTVQIVDEVSRVQGITLSNDGTTHKHINYGSHHLTYSNPSDADKGTTRFVGILHQNNHTSQTQLEGWQHLIVDMHSIYNECMQKDVVDWRQFVEKTKGMLTDHAEDQKKLVRLFSTWKQACEREVRGDRVLASLPSDRITHLMWEMTEYLIRDAGGLETWEALSAEDRHSRSNAALHDLRVRIGEKDFAALSDAEKESIDFFVWAGCCMHKDLNAVKGGTAAMMAWWQKNGIEGPIVLMNRDNSATAAEGISSTSVRIQQKSARGAVKALDLTGSVFRHKDDKKGQQDSLRFYLEAQLGYFLPWPDTSNTRYQSHCDGASAWLLYRPLYVPYLDIIMDRKDTHTLTNVEQNVYNAFHCTKTAEEMACLSTWGNCLGHPYMRQVRGSLRDHSNLLDLGPLHARLTKHIEVLIRNIELAIGPEATFETAALDRKPFERPDAFYVVQKMAQDTSTYPYLRPLLVAFLEGALETSNRFTSEFAADGTIASTSSAQRSLARMETTNDANEGALGTFRITLRRSPRMSMAQFNARLKYKKNQTGTFIKQRLGNVERKYLRRKAREMDASGEEHRRRTEQVEYDRQLVEKNRADAKRKEERKEATAAKFAAIVPCLKVDDLDKLKRNEIDLQLRWHRDFKCDKLVPRAKDLPTKKEGKLEVLQQAVERYLDRERAGTSHSAGNTPPQSMVGGDIYDSADEDGA